MKKILSILADILLVLFIILAAAVTLITLNTKDRGVTNIAGRVVLNIQTDSMKPTIQPGDLIITKKYAGEDIEKGDIISFFSVEQETTIIKTHRVVKVTNQDGTITFTTKGDNAEGEDFAQLTKNDIVAIYKNHNYDGTRIPVLGRIISFLKSQLGFLFFIIIPLFALVIYELYKFITMIIEDKKKEMLKEIEEAKLNEKA